MSSVVAVDVGGTTIKGAVVSAAGEMLRPSETETPVASGPDEVVRAVRAFTRSLVDAAGSAGTGAPGEVAAVGVVVPGSVDAANGVARFAANIGWRDVPLRSLVSDDTGLPAVLDHDVRAAGLAEATLGSTGGVGDALLVVIGTGIAGHLTVAGQPVSGSTGVAGEIGHVPVWPDGEPCPCGQRGCLERYASASGISRRYLDRTGRTAGADEILLLRPDDVVAEQVWREAIEALAVALASYTMLLDPEVVVIGGGLSRAGTQLLEPLRAALSERVGWRPCPRLELSTLGARAGLLGAAILAAGAAGIDVAPWRGTRPSGTG